MNTDTPIDKKKERLEKTKSNLRHVIQISLNAKNAADGTKTNRTGVIADALLLRNSLTALTIYQMLHPTAIDGLPALIFPDFASTAALARTILESYLAMNNIAVQQYSTDEMEFRLLWWDWHEINQRIRTLEIIRSTIPEIAAHRQQKSNLATKIASHIRFKDLPHKLRNEFRSGKRPSRSLLEHNHSIATKAGILPEHFDLQYQFLSSVTHSQPEFVNTLRKHDPFLPEVNSMLNQAVEYTTAYLALTVRDFAILCPKAKTAFDVRFVKFVEFYQTLFTTPFPDD
jgi:hypothetical protein